MQSKDTISSQEKDFSFELIVLHGKKYDQKSE